MKKWEDNESENRSFLHLDIHLIQLLCILTVTIAFSLEITFVCFLFLVQQKDSLENSFFKTNWKIFLDNHSFQFNTDPFAAIHADCLGSSLVDYENTLLKLLDFTEPLEDPEEARLEREEKEREQKEKAEREQKEKEEREKREKEERERKEKEQQQQPKEEDAMAALKKVSLIIPQNIIFFSTNSFGCRL